MKAIIAFLLLTFVLGSFGQSQPSLVLTGTAYDFSNSNSGQPQAHPDFNSYLCGQQSGMVEDQLGVDGNPVLKDRKNCVTSAETFAQWFTSTDGVNMELPVTLTFLWDDQDKAYKYRNNNFFPLDNWGYGNDNNGHNFGFCFELHTSFTYEQGQVFEFMGDDDVWVFVNSQLAIDLGGVHSSLSDSIALDSMGLTVGQTYPLDFFFCERHVTQSNLVISTSIKLDPCGTSDVDGDGIPDLCDECPKGNQGLEAYIDDAIGPNNAVTLHIGLTAPQVGTFTVTVDFGDDSPVQTFEVSGISETVTTYNYDKSGEYKIVVTGAADAGCGPAPSTDIDVTCSGKRLAPKCAAFSVVPGAPAKRKRSL